MANMSGTARVGWLIALVVAVAGCTPTAPVPLRLPELLDCPPRPSCVSTEAADPAHRIGPLTLHGLPPAAVACLRAVLADLPRTVVTQPAELALHAESTSLVWRFVDDIDVLADPTRGRFRFRSVSRIGYSDLGANRARMEDVRARYQARCGR
jgi:uncharacterized protein (DUF1499 family)